MTIIITCATETADVQLLLIIRVDNIAQPGWGLEGVIRHFQATFH